MDLVGAPRSAPGSKQHFANGEFHDWYRIILGYSDQAVAHASDLFGLTQEDDVLDPFCGTGTTLIECMKSGIRSVGIDANPSSVLAARVKTNWKLQPGRLLRALEEIRRRFPTYAGAGRHYKTDPTYEYLDSHGMLERGWISPEPLRKSLALKRAINNVQCSTAVRDALLVSMMAEVVATYSNVKFGPQLYCGPSKQDVDVLNSFSARVERMAKDLESGRTAGETPATFVYKGDSRDCAKVLERRKRRDFSAVICSPPYPTEHDYTRHARLELAFLEIAKDRSSVQSIKRRMIRSHTKGIYKEDNDGALVSHLASIETITGELRRRVEGKTHGFARLYPKLVTEYFGGMTRHFRSLRRILRPGARCAYVVGDQASFLQVHIPTAEILAEIAESEGFSDPEIHHWRSRWSTSTSSEVEENILFLTNPG